jgi:hypothetical protein
VWLEAGAAPPINPGLQIATIKKLEVSSSTVLNLYAASLKYCGEWGDHV